MNSSIYYKKGYKYQLTEDSSCQSAVIGFDIETDYIKLTEDGTFTCKKSYAYDGPSGPAIDTRSAMRGAAFHDAGYQLIRNGYLDKSYKPLFDLLFRDIILEDGMWRFRAWYFYRAVKYFGDPWVDPSAKKKVIKAP